jgi:hypothetical protein
MIRSVLIVLAVALTVSGETRRPSTDNIALKTSQARTLLDQAKAYAIRIRDSFQRDEIIDEIGSAQAKAGDLEGAVDTANLTEFPATSTLHEIGRQLAEQNDMRSARSLGTRLKDGKPYSFLPEMARTQAKAKRFAEAIRTAEEIQFPEVRSYTLEDIAVLQAATGDYEAARQTFALARTAHATGLTTKEDLENIIELTDLTRGKTPPSLSQIDRNKPAEERFGLMLGVAEAFWESGHQTEAVTWIDHALKEIAADAQFEFLRYFAIPTQVKLGQQDAAMQAAAKLSGEMRVKGFMALAVTCAELKDAGCVDTATNKMQSALPPKEQSSSFDFGLKLMTLNVTAALIDNGQTEAALRWLAVADGNRKSVSYELGVAPRAGKQRVLILAQQNRFAEALTLALKIKPDSMPDNYRGTALRMLALLQTKKLGIRAVRAWVLRLRTPEERAYALLGMAQALLNLDETKLGYTAITVH